MTTPHETHYRVDGMDCAGCAAKIDTAVRRIRGVVDAAVSVTAGTMTVHHDATVDLGAMEQKVTGLGYAVRSCRVTIMARQRARGGRAKRGL